MDERKKGEVQYLMERDGLTFDQALRRVLTSGGRSQKDEDDRADKGWAEGFPQSRVQSQEDRRGRKE